MQPALILFPFLLFSQAFDVASIKVNRSIFKGEGGEREGFVVQPGSLSLTNVTLQACVKWAYSVRDFQIAGAPGWFGTERFDIHAKASGAASEQEMKAMLQALLAERFQLKLRRETKDVPILALVAGKGGPKLRPAGESVPGSMRPENGFLVFKNMTLPEFADRLSRRPFSLDRPVVDLTGVKGSYDFALKLADDAMGLKLGLERNDGPSLFDVLPQQLGLKLESRKGPAEVLVIESANKTPTEN